MFDSVIIGLDPIIRSLPFRRKADISETSGNDGKETFGDAFFEFYKDHRPSEKSFQTACGL